MILAGSQRYHRGAIDQGDEARFLADQELLDHYPPAGLTEGIPRQHVLERAPDGRLILGDHHALAGRQTVGLEHQRQGMATGEVHSSLDRLDHGPFRGRYPVPRQEILGEGLGRFQLRRGRTRSETLQPGRAKAIDHAGGEWCLRADHGQPDVVLTGQRQQAIDILGIDRDILDSRLQRRAGIARRDQHLLDIARLRQFPGQRMLAPARSDDQNLHCRARWRSALDSNVGCGSKRVRAARPRRSCSAVQRAGIQRSGQYRSSSRSGAET